MIRVAQVGVVGAISVALVIAHALAQPAPEATPTPTIVFSCETDRCVPVGLMPATGSVDLVIVGATSPPRVQSGLRSLAVVQCPGTRKSWCVAAAPVTQLSVVASAAPPSAAGLGVEQSVRIETPRIDAKSAGNFVTIDLVRPDTTEVSSARDRPRSRTTDNYHDEYFEDVVLVGNESAYRCSGISIASRYVLTAAHCLPASRVGFGNSASDALAVRIEETTRHPSSDVAILRLAKSVTLTPRARRRTGEVEDPIGMVRIVGFGVTDQDRLTGFGRKRALSVAVDGWGCSHRRANELGCDSGRELLMRGGRGNDTCLGDSGGPLFEETPEGLRLVGITSRGTKPKKLLCGEGGIYSRVDVIADWIEKVINP